MCPGIEAGKVAPDSFRPIGAEIWSGGATKRRQAFLLTFQAPLIESMTPAASRSVRGVETRQGESLRGFAPGRQQGSQTPKWGPDGALTILETRSTVLRGAVGIFGPPGRDAAPRGRSKSAARDLRVCS